MKYEAMVKALAKPGASIMDDLTPARVELWSAATGLAGESGEVLENVKKFVVHNKPFDKGALIRELGDVEFYLEWIRQCIHVSREQVLEANQEKLSHRYPTGQYTDDGSRTRMDSKRTLINVLDELTVLPELIVVNTRTWQEMELSGQLTFNATKDCWMIRGVEVHHDRTLVDDFDLPKSFG